MSFFPTAPKRRSKSTLPGDQRHRLGGALFLVSLLVFFLATILLYLIYAESRSEDPQTSVPLPPAFLVSTFCLLVISALVHFATRAIRRERRWATAILLLTSGSVAIAFIAIQWDAMNEMLSGPASDGGTGKGVAGMVFVLVILHALHVVGGVIAIGVVSIGSLWGRYDHERHWPVDFAAQYWHFLDVVWLCMLAAFWLTTGGFDALH